jgi:predicted ATP-grasp superfamily ATP-dependent carboligase
MFKDKVESRREKAEPQRDEAPNLLAVWPGMGHVALTAGFYLMSKLHMHEEEPLDTGDLFDLEHVDVEKGVARAGHIPVSHLYAYADPHRGRPLGLVIGEAQPPLHKLEYCRRILDGAEKIGVGRVLTFAAMAVEEHPKEPSKVYGVATHREGVESLKNNGIMVLETGQIKGMNGVFLAAAAQRGIPGICLLGTMPAFAAQIPFPKASHAVLEAFLRICGLTLDLEELKAYGRSIEQHLTAGLEKIQEALETQESGEGPTPIAPAVEAESKEGPSEEDRRQIDQLLDLARKDRSKAFELKRELDRRGLFKEYENRFLDLFRRKP